MNENYNNHYIAIDSDGRIIRTWSDGTRPDIDISNAICINDRGSYQFRFYENGDENPVIMDGNVPIYLWDGERVVRRTNQEIDKDRQTLLNDKLAKPSAAERLEAQVTYTAMMTDTLLEV